jgi:Ser/Thr protein kinase RdoA (MazF antagonist)
MLFPAENDLIRRDVALRGLDTVLKPDRLVDRLRSYLHCSEPHGVEVKYARYKPGTSCLVCYGLQADGRYINIYAKAVTRAAVGKLRKTGQKYDSLGSTEPQFIILEDDAIGVFAFPLDGKIDVLPDIACDENRHRLLRYLLPQRPDLWELSLETIRYKPEHRYVGCLCANEDPVAKMKVYARPWYRAASLNARLLCSRGALHFPARMGRSARHQIVIFQWMKGRLLRDLIEEPGLDLNLMQTVGSALSEIHSQNVSGLHIVSRSDESTSLILAASELGFIFPGLSKQIREVAKGLARALERTPPLHRPVHGDFHSEQILVEDGRVVVLDTDNAACSDPSTDSGLFLAHLERDGLSGAISHTKLGCATDAFLQGYANASGGVPPNIELYTAIGLLRLAADLHKSTARFGKYERNWPQLTEALVEHAWHVLQKNQHKIRAHSIIKSKTDVPVVDPFGLSRERFLAKAMNPADAEARLRQCFCNAYDENDARLSLRAIRATRYKPERRCIVEYDVEVGSPGASPEFMTLLGKVRMRGTDVSSYRCVQSLWNSGFDLDAPDGIMVPEPVGLISEYRMWLQRKAPGRPAIDLLRGSDGVMLARRLVDATYKIQQANLIPDREQHTIMHELDILHRGLSEVSRRRPDWAERIRLILQDCMRLATSLGGHARQVFSHRDFYHDNVLVDGPHVYLLDFDLYCKADLGLDVGNFMSHLTEYALRSMRDPEALVHIEGAMEKRFAELYDEEARVFMRTYALLSLARHIYLSTLTAERSQFTEDLIKLCERRLAAESHYVVLHSLSDGGRI